MQRMVLICAFSALLALSSCGPSQGGIWPTPVWILKFGNLSLPEKPIVAGDAVQFAVTWQDGRAPYTVNWQFGAGMEPAEMTASTSESTHTADVVAVNESDSAADYHGLVSITDTDGTIVSEDISYTVEPATSQ